MNTSLICLSVKYLDKRYELISKVSKWVYYELTKVNYTESKFIKSLDMRQIEIIGTLIKFNKDIKIINRFLVTYCRYKNNYFDLIKLLIDNGADIYVQNEQSFIFATINGHTNIVELFLIKKANDSLVGKHVISSQGKRLTVNDEALMYACGCNHFDIVKLLINNGANIHVEDDESLKSASQNGHYDIVKLLIDNGADIHAEDDKALKKACNSGHYHVVKLLIDNGADIHAEDNCALKLASDDGHYDVVKLLIDNGASDIEALKLACSNGHFHIVNSLVFRGVNIHAEDDEALKLASSNGYLDIVQLLIDNGANIYAKDNEAFKLACYNGRDDVVDLFCSVGQFD